MIDPGEALVQAAVQLVDTPFRLHGRDPGTGLDCVGLVSAAMAASGGQPVPPAGYTLRNLAIVWMAFTLDGIGWGASRDLNLKTKSVERLVKLCEQRNEDELVGRLTIDLTARTQSIRNGHEVHYRGQRAVNKS